MTSSLLLKLHGPLQSWGTDSRFASRRTDHEPSKSAIVGLLAAAGGRRRTDPIEDLASLEFGVRTDQPGKLVRDFQTAQNPVTDKYPRITHRYYLADATFVVALSADPSLLEAIVETLKRPVFPLFLGRRSCTLNHDFLLGIREGNVDQALRSEPWHASESHRRQQPRIVFLPVIRDAVPGDKEIEDVRDLPVSFNPEHRQYSWRSITRPEPVIISNQDGTDSDRDPIFEAVDN